MTTQTAKFVIASHRCQITLDTARNHVSFMGMFDGASGQVVDDIKDATSSADVERLCEIWESIHLKQFPLNSVQSKELAEARELLKEIDGQRFDCPKPEDLDDATFSNSSDVIDSRDIMRRIEELTDFLADVPDAIDGEPDDYSDARNELAILQSVESQAEGYGDWHHGETLIRHDHFTDYAEELVKDISDMPSKIPFYIVIDWEATAENLKVDYMTIDYDGVEYLMRS